MSRRAYSIEQRDRVHDRLLEMAHADERVVAGAVVGSVAAGKSDRWSDIDLTFGLGEGATAADVLADWTAALGREFQASHLFDLLFLSSVYRVFLVPGGLQVDLSFAPAAEFGALGPHFKLLFGEAVSRPHVPAPSAAHLAGLAAHHAVRARICIERGRAWQAEYWISGVRDQALSLACLARGLEPAHGRGFDALPAGMLSPFEAALVRSLERDELLRALRHAIDLLMKESPELAPQVAEELRALSSDAWGEV